MGTQGPNSASSTGRVYTYLFPDLDWCLSHSATICDVILFDLPEPACHHSGDSADMGSPVCHIDLLVRNGLRLLATFYSFNEAGCWNYTIRADQEKLTHELRAGSKSRCLGVTDQPTYLKTKQILEPAV